VRTRTIVILVVAGLALLVLPQLGDSDEGAKPTNRDDQAEPATAEEPATTPESSAPEAPLLTTTSTVPPTTARAEIERRGMGDPVAQRWPLTNALPKDAPGWRIDYRVEGERLVLAVMLRAVLNRPEQLEAYRADLRTYKAQALDWLRSMGADPAAYPIEWRPPEAAAL
jgi:hypothetical protein